MKRLLAIQGVAISSEVRAPLRDLTHEEGAELAAWFQRLN
jgi:dihydrodipicolinate synthase/N-acetylneuraminate lyase